MINFNEYPYRNLTDLNLDYLEKKMNVLKEIMDTFVTLNTVTFADPIIWNITTQYARNTVVLDTAGNAYLSKVAVPAGVQLNNGDYWLEIFNFTEYTRTANQNLTINVETNTTRATHAYNVDDWLIWNDVLYKVTSAIAIDDTLITAPTAGANIIHFTVEDFIKAFMTWATNTIQQYKNDIDASELLYRQQLAGDIANTTASLQAQLDAAIAGATVDSEVINARIGADGVTYSTLGEAIRTQVGRLNYNSDVLYDTLNGKSTFINVVVASVDVDNNGVLIYQDNHRLTTLDIIELDYSVVIEINEGYTGWIAYYDENDDFIRWENLPPSGQILAKYISAGTRFRIVLRTVGGSDPLKIEDYKNLTLTNRSFFYDFVSANANYSDSGYNYKCLYSFSDIDKIVFGGASSTGITKTRGRLTTSDIRTAENDIIIKAREGYNRVTWIAYYDSPDDVNYSTWEWIRDTVLVSAGTHYRVTIASYPERDMEAYEAFNAIYVQTPMISASNADRYIKICSFNVGLWYNGVTAGVPESEVNSYIIRWHKLIGETNPDIILMQEATQYFNRNNTMDPYTAILQFKYPYKYNVGFNTSYSTSIKQMLILSKYPLISPNAHIFDDGDTRGYITFKLDLYGQIVSFICTHLSIEANSTGIRQTEISKLVAYIADESNVIMCGDLNTYDLTELDAFKNAGLQVANDGLFGTFETWPHTRPAWPNGCIDNIIAKNFDIQNVEMGDINDATGTQPLSDHVPLFATIKIN